MKYFFRQPSAQLKMENSITAEIEEMDISSLCHTYYGNPGRPPPAWGLFTSPHQEQG